LGWGASFRTITFDLLALLEFGQHHGAAFAHRCLEPYRFDTGTM
jgi:hypothetical protein